MRRREFIVGVAGAAVWPLMAHAQLPAVPVIGYLDSGSLETRRGPLSDFHRGLAEAGYFEGRDLAVEYRWAEDHYERLPALAADLVSRQVAVIVAVTTPAALAAKAATKSIPIAFFIAGDPVDVGLVDSLNRPRGNLTGISALLTATAAKRLELLHELVPAAMLIAYLDSPINPVGAEAETRELQVAARALGVQLLTLNASDTSEFDAAFATLVRERAGGLLVGQDPLFNNHSDRLIALAARHAVPAIYWSREATAAGGLMSYGTDLRDPRRLAGVYAGRILKGEKPADLPVQQVTKIELVINIKTAKTLGLTFPRNLLARADAIIE